jgi:hypothetical protein
VTTSLGPERPVFGVIGTTLRQGWLPRPSSGHAKRTGQLAASTRRWPYPTHWVTGAAAARCHSGERAPRPGVHSTKSRALHCTNSQATMLCGQATPSNRRTATRQLPHCYQPTNAAAQLQPTAISTSTRTITPFYRRIQHHITGRNKRSLSGPHKLYGVDCLNRTTTSPQTHTHTHRHTHTHIYIYIYIYTIHDMCI